MSITLPADQEHWIETCIANGDFQSAEDAVRQFTAERMIVDNTDISQAQTLVDEPRAAVAAARSPRWKRQLPT